MRHKFNLLFLSHQAYATFLVPEYTPVYVDSCQDKEMKHQFNLFFPIKHMQYFLFQYIDICRLLSGKAKR